MAVYIHGTEKVVTTRRLLTNWDDAAGNFPHLGCIPVNNFQVLLSIVSLDVNICQQSGSCH